VWWWSSGEQPSSKRVAADRQTLLETKEECKEWEPESREIPPSLSSMAVEERAVVRHPPSQQAVVEQRYMDVDEENVEPLRDAPRRRMPSTPALVRRGGSRATGEVGKDASRLLV
jgi:hypothetical protein